MTREEAIKCLEHMKIDMSHIGDEYNAIMEAIKALEQEPKTGHWIKSKDGYMRCDKCGSRGSAIKARFCHHCGAWMESEDKSCTKVQ